MSIAERTRNKTLTREDLANPTNGDEINQLDDGNTPLGWAVLNGDVRTVRLLLEHKASVKRKAANGLSLLHLAVDAKVNAFRVVNILLQEPQTAIDEEDEFYPHDTPLMRALKNNPDPAIVKLFKDRGASTTTPNAKGESANDIADRLLNIKAKDALLDENEQGATGTSLTRFIVAGAYLLNDYLKPKPRVQNSVLEAYKIINNQLVETHNPPPANMYPKTKKELEEILDDVVASHALESFFPPTSSVLQNILIKAHAVVNDSSLVRAFTRSRIQMHFKMALYQPVIYCDDSGSMGVGGRMASQTDIVSYMADLLLLFSPAEKGVHLRFINSSASGLDQLKGDALRQKVNIPPSGGTKIGTSLNEKVLQPFVYSKIAAKEKFERPYLVIVITDGCPDGEAVETFQQAIDACRKNVSDAKLPAYSVKFNVNQIGNDDKAAAFLDKLQILASGATAKDDFHVTADKLDIKYYQLRDNKDNLEDWLRDVLTPRP